MNTSDKRSPLRLKQELYSIISGADTVADDPLQQQLEVKRRISSRRFKHLLVFNSDVYTLLGFLPQSL